MKFKNSKVYLFLCLLLASNSFAQAPMDLELEDPEDMNLLLEEFPDNEKGENAEDSEQQASTDDLN